MDGAQAAPSSSQADLACAEDAKEIEPAVEAMEEHAGGGEDVKHALVEDLPKSDMARKRFRIAGEAARYFYDFDEDAGLLLPIRAKYCACFAAAPAPRWA